MSRSEHHKAGFALPRRRIEDVLTAHFRGLRQDEINAVTHSLCLSLFFRKSVGEEGIVFSHRSFREFLVARYLVGLLVEHAGDPGRVPSPEIELTSVRLGEQELTFSAELLIQHPAEVRKAVAGILDEWYRDRRAIYLLDPTELTIETGPAERQIARARTGKNRSANLVVNAESLGLGCRLGRARPEMMVWRFELGGQPVADDKYRTVFDMGVLSIAYETSTGEPAIVRHWSELEDYRHWLELMPEHILPVCHVGASHFAASKAGFRFHWLNRNFAFPAQQLIEYARVLELATHVGLNAAWPLELIGRAQGTFVLPMCSASGGTIWNLRHWARIARDYVDSTDLLLGGDAHAQQLLLRLAYPDHFDWASVIAAFDEVLAESARSTERSTPDGAPRPAGAEQSSSST